MRTILGKNVYENAAEAVQPPNTALLVIDMQNDFAHPEGHHSQRGLDITPISDIIPTVVELVDAARSAGVHVIWIMNSVLPGGKSDSPAWLAFRAHHRNAWAYTLEGTWGQGIVAPLQPAEDEVVVRKFRSSAFVSTPLDRILRSQGIETTVICGCVTEGCVSSTARSASAYDYYTFLVGDGMASTDRTIHQAALTVLGSRYPIHDAKEYVNIWSR